MKKNNLYIILTLLGIIFLIVGVSGILKSGETLKSANYNSASLASGVILLLGSLQYCLIMRQKEHVRRKWISVIVMFILILMVVAILSGVHFLFMSNLLFGLKTFVFISYIIVPVFFMLNFLFSNKKSH